MRCSCVLLRPLLPLAALEQPLKRRRSVGLFSIKSIVWFRIIKEGQGGVLHPRYSHVLQFLTLEDSGISFVSSSDHNVEIYMYIFIVIQMVAGGTVSMQPAWIRQS